MATPFGLYTGPWMTHDVHPPPIPLPAPAGFSANVIINGLPVHHAGNTSLPHGIPPAPPNPRHPDIIIDPTCIPNVWVNGRPAARQGTETQFGSKVIVGSQTVFANTGAL